MKRTFVLLAFVGLTFAGAVAPAQAAGPGNGSAGCTLANQTHYDNPAAMLKALSERDGSFQETVAEYNFGSVGNLIAKKCGA